MRNFKLHIDIVDLWEYISVLDLIEYRNFFMIVFVEATDPDEACYLVRQRIKHSILEKSDSIENRIICRLVNRLLRIDKIYSL